MRKKSASRLFSSLITRHSSLILRKQSAVVGGRRCGYARELHVLFDVRAAAHAYERGGDAGRRARELYGGLRVGLEGAERHANVLGQVLRDLALKYRSARDDRQAQSLRRFEQRDVRALVGLVLVDQSLGHREVERQLHEAEAVRVAADLARELNHAL